MKLVFVLFDSLNRHLLGCCLRERQRTVAGRAQTIGEMFREADKYIWEKSWMATGRGIGRHSFDDEQATAPARDRLLRKAYR